MHINPQTNDPQLRKMNKPTYILPGLDKQKMLELNGQLLLRPM